MYNLYIHTHIHTHIYTDTDTNTHTKQSNKPKKTFTQFVFQPLIILQSECFHGKNMPKHLKARGPLRPDLGKVCGFIFARPVSKKHVGQKKMFLSFRTFIFCSNT